MTTPSYILSAMGMVNALGVSSNDIWWKVLRGDSSGLQETADLLPGKKVRVGRVPFRDEDVSFPKALAPFYCRNNILILKCYEQIQEPLQALIRRYGADRVGVVMGSSTSGVSSTESAFLDQHTSGRFPQNFHYVQHELSGAADFVGRLANLKGPTYTLSTACSSSAKAFASARALIRDNWCDAVVVGGADSLCRLTLEGFGALETLSDHPCNSMSRNRNGFNIGEGAVLFLLEKGTSGVALKGVGETSDSYHMSAPSPNGEGAAQAILRSLADAGASPEKVAYVCLHGTGTILNDLMEARVVQRLFSQTPVSSIKAMLGHTLGAAGAMNAGLCWLSLTLAQGDRAEVPPHLWDGQKDEGMAPLKLVERGDTILLKEDALFLSNSFGFGGSNCSLLLGRCTP